MGLSRETRPPPCASRSVSLWPSLGGSVTDTCLYKSLGWRLVSLMLCGIPHRLTCRRGEERRDVSPSLTGAKWETRHHLQ